MTSNTSRHREVDRKAKREAKRREREERQIAKRLGVSKQTISNWLSNSGHVAETGQDDAGRRLERAGP